MIEKQLHFAKSVYEMDWYIHSLYAKNGSGAWKSCLLIVKDMPWNESMSRKRKLMDSTASSTLW